MKLNNLTLLLRDGLANRMRVIASAVQFARQGVKINVLWTKNWALNCDFEELFDKIYYKYNKRANLLRQHTK